MLKNLYIENIAVIEKTTIDFSNGLNGLTGETGAGKSIVIDSINAVLGNRTSRDLIRNGSESAFVSAEFEDISQKALETLHEYVSQLQRKMPYQRQTCHRQHFESCRNVSYQHSRSA